MQPAAASSLQIFSPPWKAPPRARQGAYSIYGSVAHKQVYLYGGLDTSPTVLSRGYGMAWGVGGWLLPNFLAKAGRTSPCVLRSVWLTS